MPGVQMAPQGNVDPNQIIVYQQNIQRAFIQSAVAQNLQIQQHLMAQNQALQQLLSQSVPVSNHDQFYVFDICMNGLLRFVRMLNIVSSLTVKKK